MCSRRMEILAHIADVRNLDNITSLYIVKGEITVKTCNGTIGTSLYNNGRTDDSFSLIVLYYTFTHTVLLCNITVYQCVIGGVKADAVPVEAPKKANSMPTVLN